MTTFRPSGRESTSLLCPVCKQPQRTEGWLLWHVSKYHPDYIYGEGSPARASGKDDPDKYIKGKYGHMVCPTKADCDRIMAERKRLRGV